MPKASESSINFSVRHVARYGGVKSLTRTTTRSVALTSGCSPSGHARTAPAWAQTSPSGLCKLLGQVA